MEDDRFDALSRAWSGGFSRRALGSLATGALAALGLTVAAPGAADAKKKKKKKKKKPPVCTPSCAGNACGVSDGCGGTCQCGTRFECSDPENGGVCECPGPFISCNNNTLCCPEDEPCIANKCCFEDLVCNGEECCTREEACTTGDGCCPEADACNGEECCGVGESCTPFDGCCPTARACPDACCEDGQVCCGGECCPSGACANDICCRGGNVCASTDDCCGALDCIAADEISICCTQPRFCPLSLFCCDDDETCIDDDDECCPNERVFNNACCPVERFCGTTCCPAGQACCGGECIDVLDDEQNCGGCGVVCAQDQACVVGECLGPDQYRIVLRWGQEPRDLDAHLWLPAGENGENKAHVYYDNPGASGAFPFATFDGDVRTGFGPETISIFQLLAGTYTYAANLVFYPGEGTLGTSGAVVEVHQGGAATNPIETYTVPDSDDWTDGNGDFAWWDVFRLESDGTTAEIIDVNQPSGDPAPYPDDGLLRRSRAEGKGKGAVADDASSRHGKRRRESGRGKNGAGTRSKRR